MNARCRFAISLFSLLVSACSFSTHARTVGDPTLSERPLEIRPIESPQLLVDPFSDQTGWHLEVQQPAEALMATQSTQQWESQRASFSPLSVVIGLVQCPWGLLVSTLSHDAIGHDAHTYGCERLLMREPVPGTLTYAKTTTLTTTVNSTTTPSMGHTLAISHPHESRPFLTRSIDGNLHLTLNEILTAWRNPHKPLTEIHLTLNQGSNIIESTRLDIPAHTDTPPRPTVLPRPLCILIQSDDPSLAHHLTYWALYEGWCVAAGKIEQARVREELLWQHSGAVDDSARSPLGQWIPPTVLLQARWVLSEETKGLDLQLTSLESSEILVKVWMEASHANAALLPLEAWAHLRWQVKTVLENR